MEAPPARAASAPFTNYRLYRARHVPRTYLVVSTFFDRDGRREEPDPGAFEERFAIESLLEDLRAAQSVQRRDGTSARRRAPVTLRTHGYNTRLGDFARDLLGEAGGAPEESFRSGGRVLIGFRWPSEGLFSGRSVRDTLWAVALTAAVGLAMLLVPLLALVPAPWSHAPLLPLAAGAPLATIVNALLWPWLTPLAAALLLGAGLLLVALRLSTYARDRYRAIHYGVPDLGEFMSDLETGLAVMGVRVVVDMVGHSMGCLLLVNAVRVMSDFFHRPGAMPRTLGHRGAFLLRTLVLCAPDIPAALASPERNNYFLSSLRRFASVHVLSSDRDIILKWASTLANWTSEPRHDMAGRHLGNVLLVRDGSLPARLRAPRRVGPFLPVTRPQLRNWPVLDPRTPEAPHARLAWVHFHDCSACPSLGGGTGRPVAVSLTLVAIAVALHAWLTHPGTLWLVAWGAILLGAGSLARFVSGWRDHWRLGPLIGALADAPSVAGFGKRMNPHSGYFAAGDEPRRLIARLLARPLRPPAPGQSPGLVKTKGRIRTSAVALPV